jgi:lysophospholipase L1-like esterase
MDRIRFGRHDPQRVLHPQAGISIASLPYTRTQAGVCLRLRSASPWLALEFVLRADGGQMGLRQGFAVFCDDTLLQVSERLDLRIAAPAPGVHDYQIVLPSYAAVDLVRLALAPGHDLLPLPPDRRPVYVAMGDSITNGFGQQSASHLSYPFVLARGFGWQLVNLGVSGARTGPALAPTLAGQRADIVTVAFGFNDWYWSAAPLEDRLNAYAALLDGLRSQQPQALIVAITPLSSTADPRKARAPYSLAALRAGQRRRVEEARRRGDLRLHVLDGEALSTPAMLVDGIHLHVEGAAAYAGRLAQALAALPGQNFAFRLRKNWRPFA